MMRIHRVGVFAIAFTLLSAVGGPAQQQRKEGGMAFPPQHNYLLSLAYSPDGNYVAYCGTESSVFIVEAGSGRKFRELVGHAAEVYSVAFSPDGSLLATAGADGALKLWAWRSGELRGSFALQERGGPVFGIAFSPGGEHLASALSDSVVRVWSVPKGELLFDRRVGLSHCASVVFAPGGKELIVGGWQGEDKGAVEIWSLSTGQLKRRRTFAGKVSALAVVRRSGEALVGDVMGEVSIYDLDKDQVRKSLKVHDGMIRGIEVSPDEKLFATVVSWATPDVKVWSLGPPERAVFSITNDLDGATALRFSPDGREVGVIGRDNIIRFWEASTGNKVRSIEPVSH
jgi:WD40 repeat protein